jgi:hypothetical protein
MIKVDSVIVALLLVTLVAGCRKPQATSPSESSVEPPIVNVGATLDDAVAALGKWSPVADIAPEKDGTMGYLFYDRNGYDYTVYVDASNRVVRVDKRKTANSGPQPNTGAAIAFVKKSYPWAVVEKMDDKTIGVIWETRALDPLKRADDPFERLKLRLKKDYGIDIVITAIE